MVKSSSVRRLVAAGVVVSLAAAPAAVAAGGAVTLGPADPNRAGQLAQTINYTTPPVFVNTVVPPGESVVAPADGVITGWTLYTGQVTTEGATVQLRVLTRNGDLTVNGGGSFTFAGSGPAHKVAPVASIPDSGVKHTFTNLHVPIKAGQYAGYSLMRNATGSFLVRLPVPVGYKFAQAQQDGGFANGSTSTLTGISDQLAAYHARFERDADRDRFGDTTQDRCTAFAGIYDGCVTKMTSSKSEVKRGKKVRVKILGAKVGRKYTIRLSSGKVLASGKVPKSGMVSRSVRIPRTAKIKNYGIVFKTSKPKEKTKVVVKVKR